MHRTCFRGDLGCRFALAVCAQGDEGIGLRQRMLRQKQAGGAWRDGRCCAGGATDGGAWCIDKWLAGSHHLLRRTTAGGLQRDSRCCAVRWRVVCGEVDGHCTVSWRADGVQGADGCCAVRWQADGGESAGGTQSARRMLRGKQADGAQRVRSADTGKPPPVMPTAYAHKGMRASACIGGCCARSKRMARGGPASCQQKVRRDYIWLAKAIAISAKGLFIR